MCIKPLNSRHKCFNCPLRELLPLGRFALETVQVRTHFMDPVRTNPLTFIAAHTLRFCSLNSGLLGSIKIALGDAISDTENVNET